MWIAGVNRRIGKGALFVLGALLLVSLSGLAGTPAVANAQSVNAARAAYDSGNYDDTVSILRNVLSNGKKNTDAHYLLGLALKRQGHLDEAYSEFLISVDQQKKNHDARFELSLQEIRMGRFEDAQKTIEEGLKRTKDKDARFFYAQGQLAIAQEDLPSAMVLFTRAQSIDPGNPLYLRGLGDVYEAQNVWALAISNYRQALAMEPDSPDAPMIHYRIGQLHFEARQWNESYAAFQKATELDPDLEDAWYQQGYIQFIATRYPLVVEPLEKYVALDQTNAEAYFMLAESLNKTQRIKMAVPHYMKTIELDPGRVEAYLPMGDGLVAEGRYMEAVNAYKEAVMQNADNAELHFSLGWVQTQPEVGQYDDGIVNLKKSIELDGSSEKPYIQLALVYFDQEKYSEAVPYLEEAIKVNPADSNPYAYYGRSYIAQGQYAQAVTAVKAVLEPAIQAAEDERARITLSNVYYNLGREIYSASREAERDQRPAIYAASLDMYRAKVAHDNTDYFAFLNMGITGLVAQDGAVARDALLSALDLRTAEAEEDPTSILQPLKYLGTAYLILEDYGNARTTFQRVLEIDPTDHEAYYRLGFDRILNDDWGGAIGQLRKAVELKPDEASYHLLLAQAYTNSQQLAPAIRHYRECLKLDPNNGTAREQLNNVQTIYEQLQGD
ncbi:MAG: tetratricopeptide repeat protein [Gemmatimonadetes bacterium]|nr:tetratricopeptide repeat protein [Gemmatimonadota bacterium]